MIYTTIYGLYVSKSIFNELKNDFLSQNEKYLYSNILL